jgi:epothilone polyketide synthase D
MFDNSLFGISAAEAEAIDPNQRMMLEVGFEALYDAGRDKQTLRDAPIGVFVGMSGSDWVSIDGDRGAGAYAVMGSSSGCPANRLSYALGLKGPSMTIDTLCSSSLVALDNACSYLRLGKCDTALVGGVNVLLSPKTYEALSAGGFLSPDGYVHALRLSRG